MAEQAALEASLRRVHRWAYPLLLAQRLRQNMTSMPPDERSAAAPLGRMGHQRRLSDPGYRVGVAPNVDTLYSVAWVDLEQGPGRVDLPSVPERYYTLQVGFADSTSVAVGLRTHGEQLPPVVVRRSRTPQPSAPPGAVHLESPTRYVMFALRILVDGDSVEDLSTVWALQDRVVLWSCSSSGWTASGEESIQRSGPGAGTSGGGNARASTGAGAWLTDVHAVARDIDPSEIPPLVLADLDLLSRSWVETSGAGPAHSGYWDSALAAADLLVAESVSTTARSVNGWTVNVRGCAFGDDWDLRAAVAHSQIFINPAQEAVYPVAERDDQGRPLTGEHQYEMTFGPGRLPPARYFWSLTMYHAAGLLVENAAQRYSIGDRTPGLSRGDDGSLVVRISTEDPASGPGGESGGAAWLPAPAGPFRLMLRLYGPEAEVLDGSWAPPPVRRLQTAASTSVPSARRGAR